MVPFNAFSEPDPVTRRPVWFALDESEPLAFFAGIAIRDWTCTRKVKEGPVTCDLFAFPTTASIVKVAAVHLKAMPAILTTLEECEPWLTAP